MTEVSEVFNTWISILALLGGAFGFLVAIILVPLVKWINDIHSKASDAEKRAIEKFATKDSVYIQTKNTHQELHEMCASIEKRIDKLETHLLHELTKR